MKLRIVKQIINLNGLIYGGNYTTQYLIQKKTLLGWKDVTSKELNNNKKVTFDTYENTLNHMFTKYFKDGNVTQSGNVYTNQKHTLYF